jgi:hypothetical protein
LGGRYLSTFVEGKEERQEREREREREREKRRNERSKGDKRSIILTWRGTLREFMIVPVVFFVK